MTQPPITKKSLGQHWLNDSDALEAMCEAANISTDDTVLEIGPGLGSLTAKLVTRARHVVTVEFDEHLANELPRRIQATNLSVVNEDILHFDFKNLPPHYKVVANIPYYLTSNLLRVLCESTNPFKKAALLVQKEVANRIAAEPGDMSLLSVSVQFYCEVSMGQTVPAELFIPVPKVDSKILLLTYRETPLYPGADHAQYFQVVRAGFAQRRKTLLNSLGAGLNLSRETAHKLITDAKLSPATRAQTLSLEDWFRLYQVYGEYNLASS